MPEQMLPRTQLPVGSEWGDRGVYRPRELGVPSAGTPWRLGATADVPDTVLDAGRVGTLEVRAASTRGAAHRSAGTARQDAVGVTEFEGRFVLAAVAEGPARESTRVVRQVLEYLNWGLTGIDLDVVGATCAACPDWSVALTSAEVEVDPAGREHRYRLARVGAGSAFLLTGGEFLPLFGAGVDQADGVLRPGEALVLVSDGVPVTDGLASAHLARAWAEPPGPVAYLHQLQFDLPPFDDDRTAVVVWADEGFPFPPSAGSWKSLS